MGWCLVWEEVGQWEEGEWRGRASCTRPGPREASCAGAFWEMLDLAACGGCPLELCARPC